MMVTKRKNNGNDQVDRPPTQADVTPPAYPQNEYKFEIQALFEIQKTLGEVKTSMDGLNKSLDSTKSKVEDLIKWKNMIVGGAVVFGALVSLLGFVIGKGWDYVTIKAPSAPSQQVQSQLPPPHK